MTKEKVYIRRPTNEEKRLLEETNTSVISGG